MSYGAKLETIKVSLQQLPKSLPYPFSCSDSAVGTTMAGDIAAMMYLQNRIAKSTDEALVVKHIHT